MSTPADQPTEILYAVTPSMVDTPPRCRLAAESGVIFVEIDQPCSLARMWDHMNQVATEPIWEEGMDCVLSIRSAAAVPEVLGSDLLGVVAADAAARQPARWGVVTEDAGLRDDILALEQLTAGDGIKVRCFRRVTDALRWLRA
ncbi:MAG: hypothetical protein ACOCZK_05460 [Planctomycetota bacterium]